MDIFTIVLTALACYFLGNHNGAICVSNTMGDDVRSHGSGNAGLTNFIRNYGIRRAALVVAIDAGKAVLACLIAGAVFAPWGMRSEGMAFGGLFVMLGHDFPVLQGFRGGKGILSGWFIAWTVDWRIAVAIFVVFACAYGLTRYVSLGSVLAAFTFVACFLLLHRDNLWLCICGSAMGLLAVYMHRANILRLLRGQESKTNLLGKGKQN